MIILLNISEQLHELHYIIVQNVNIFIGYLSMHIEYWDTKRPDIFKNKSKNWWFTKMSIEIYLLSCK